jgi:hypothetical protein
MGLDIYIMLQTLAVLFFNASFPAKGSGVRAGRRLLH